MNSAERYKPRHKDTTRRDLIIAATTVMLAISLVVWVVFYVIGA
jgi:hypothetical protein